ncbi:MAG: hypothetical protein QG589_118 [Patescibacteria group bacterium]|nr:hypothetical protein [Patescibacteria group bacterium]
MYTLHLAQCSFFGVPCLSKQEFILICVSVFEHTHPIGLPLCLLDYRIMMGWHKQHSRILGMKVSRIPTNSWLQRDNVAGGQHPRPFTFYRVGNILYMEVFFMNTSRDEEMMAQNHHNPVRHIEILVVAGLVAVACTVFVWVWGNLMNGLEVNPLIVFFGTYLVVALCGWVWEHARIVIQDIDEHRGA